MVFVCLFLLPGHILGSKNYQIMEVLKSSCFKSCFHSLYQLISIGHLRKKLFFCLADTRRSPPVPLLPQPQTQKETFRKQGSLSVAQPSCGASHNKHLLSELVSTSTNSAVEGARGPHAGSKHFRA